MKHNQITITTILLIILFSNVGLTLAQTAAVGVSKGETFDYSYTATWNSTNPAASAPSIFSEYQNIQSVQLKVIDVSGAVLTLDVTKIRGAGRRPRKQAPSTSTQATSK